LLLLLLKVDYREQDQDAEQPRDAAGDTKVEDADL
jgi:hypothetical protein